MKTISITTSFVIPDAYKYVAIDEDGAIYAFTEKPHVNLEFNVWAEASGDVLMLAETTPDLTKDLNWTETLQEI